MKTNLSIKKYYGNNSKTIYQEDIALTNAFVVLIWIVLVLFTLPFILIGTFFIFSSCKGLHDTYIIENKCELVQATVIEFKEVELNKKSGTIIVSYDPVFSYEYNDKTYRNQVDGDYMPGQERVEKGQKADIYVSSDDPDKIYYPSEKVDVIDVVPSIIDGSLFLLISLIIDIGAFIKLFRGEKREKYYHSLD